MPTEAPAPTSMLDALVNMPNPPPDDTPKGPAAAPVVQQNGTQSIQEPEIKPLVDEEPESPAPADKAPETAQDGAEKAKGEEEQPSDNPFDTLESRMRQSPPEKKAAPKPEAKPATEEKPADDAAKPDAEAAAKRAERDKDFPQLSPQAHPKTAKVFRDLTAKAVAARDERDQAAAKAQQELTALQRQVQELTAKASAAPKVEIPKEIETELATLREKVREFDITADPQIVSKYDAPQKQNNEAIIGILKGHKYGFTKKEGSNDLVEDPQAIPILLKQGLTHDTLQPLIDKLKGAGQHGDARKLERYLDHNETLQEQKAREIADWKGNYESRRQMTEAQAKKAQEQHAETVRKVTEQHVITATEEIAKAFPQLKAPPAPLPNDTPAVAKAKQEALDAFNAAEAKVQAEIQTFNGQNIKPEEVPNLIGRVTAAAMTSAMLRHRILPAVQKELAASAARIKELEAQLEARENAGKLSRLQVGGNEATAQQPKFDTLEDAFKNAVPGSAQG